MPDRRETGRRGPLPGARAARIPERTVTRLSIYLRCLEEVQADGLRAVSSKQL
ncbi:MAG: winged-helix domain-containing protein, partial [candidate division NC10 bacterium]